MIVGKGVKGVLYEPTSGRTALIIIDAQQEYFASDGRLYTPNANGIRTRLQQLLDAARRRDLLVVFIRHVHAADGSDVGRMGDFDDTEVFVEGSPGVEIVPELEVQDDPVIDKTRYSAFVNTQLQSLLEEHEIDTVIISGLMTQYCSVTTARHAHDLDYRVIFVHDANTGPDLPDLGFGAQTHEATAPVVWTMLAGGVAEVVSTDEVVAAMK